MTSLRNLPDGECTGPSDKFDWDQSGQAFRAGRPRPAATQLQVPSRRLSKHQRLRLSLLLAVAAAVAWPAHN